MITIVIARIFGRPYLSPSIPKNRPLTDELKWYGEGTQRGNHLHAWVGIGEEDFTQGVGHKAVDAKIEPLHRVAQEAAVIAFFQFTIIDDGHILKGDGLYFFLLSIFFLCYSALSARFSPNGKAIRIVRQER